MKNPLWGIPTLGGMGVPGLGIMGPGILDLGGVPKEDGGLRGRGRRGLAPRAGLGELTGGRGRRGLAPEAGLGELTGGLGTLLGRGLGCEGNILCRL